MKKALFIFIVFISCNYAYSQNGRFPTTGFGIKGGVALTGYNIEGNVHGFEGQLAKPLTGFYGGITAFWGMKSLPINIRGEIIYEAAKLTKTYSWGGTTTMNINSFSFPVMTGISLTMLDSFMLNISLGPVLNIMSQAKLNGSEELSTAELFRKPTVSFAAGAGITFWKLTLDVRYNLYPANRNINLVTSSGNIEKTVLKTWGSWNFGIGIIF